MARDLGPIRMRAFVLLAVAGCASPAQLQVARTNMLVPGASPLASGTCAATLTVRVRDAAGNPVPGATVTSHESERMNAPSMVPTQHAYATLPVVTNARGEASVCPPERLPGAGTDMVMFTRWMGAYIEARLDERVGRLLPPYRDAIVLGMP